MSVSKVVSREMNVNFLFSHIFVRPLGHWGKWSGKKWRPRKWRGPRMTLWPWESRSATLPCEGWQLGSVSGRPSPGRVGEQCVDELGPGVLRWWEVRFSSCSTLCQNTLFCFIFIFLFAHIKTSSLYLVFSLLFLLFCLFLFSLIFLEMTII